MASAQSTAFPQIGQELGERRAGDAGARLEVGGRPCRHRGPDHPEAALLPADPSGAEHGRLAGAGLADHQVVAVARGEQCPHAVSLFAVEMHVVLEYVFDRGRGDPASSLAHACGGGTDDALLGGQQLGCRVSPVAGRGRDDVAAPGPNVLGTGIGVGQDADDPIPFEKRGRERRCFVGGDIECPGHSTECFPAGERRSEQGDGQCPGGGGTGVREALLVDLPVVERHAILASEDPENLLDLFGSMRRGHFGRPRQR